MRLVKFLLNLPQNILLLLVKFYQKVLSPDHSFWSKVIYPQGYCKFHPTCSEYTYQAIKQKGAIKGLFYGSKRVLRCNPWSEGGIDHLK